MADFQSFLLQSMHMIGLQEDSTSVGSASSITTMESKASEASAKNDSQCSKNSSSSIESGKLNSQASNDLNKAKSASNLQQPKDDKKKQPEKSTEMPPKKSTAAAAKAKETPKSDEKKVVTLQSNIAREGSKKILAEINKLNKMMDRGSTKEINNIRVNKLKAENANQSFMSSMGNISVSTNETYLSQSISANTACNVSQYGSDEFHNSNKTTPTIVEKDFPEPPNFLDLSANIKNDHLETSFICREEEKHEKDIDQESCTENSTLVRSITQIKGVNLSGVDKHNYTNDDENIDKYDNQELFHEIKDDTNMSNAELQKSINLDDIDFTQKVPTTIALADDKAKASEETAAANKKLELSRQSIVRQRDPSHDNEREAKSPKPVSESISQKFLKRLGNDFSPLKSIFNKSSRNKAAKQSSSSKSEATTSQSTASDANFTYQQNPQISANKESKKNAAVPNPLESALMEPFLAKFEEEILRKAKSEILNDYKFLKEFQKSAVANNDDDTAVKKYVDEIKNTSTKKSLIDSSNKYETFNDKKFLSDINKKALEELCKLDEHNIPWEDLEELTAVSILNRIRLNSAKRFHTLPVIYNSIGEKIDTMQINKWLKSLEASSAMTKGKRDRNDSSEREDDREKELSPVKEKKKSKLLGLKRGEVVARTPPKKPTLEKKNSGTSRDLNNLYANVASNEFNSGIKVIPRSRQDVHESSMRAIYENENNLNTKQKTKKKPAVISERRRMEIESFEENNTMQSDCADETQSEDLEEEIGRATNRRRNRQMRTTSEDLAPKKDNRNRHETLRNGMNDHFYNEINEMELKQTLKKRNNQLISGNMSRERDRDRFAASSETNLAAKTQHRAMKKTAHSSSALHENDDFMEDKARTMKPTSLQPKVKPLHTSSQTLKPGEASGGLKKSSAAEAAKNLLRRPMISLAKLKSPERKILYNDWFTIIKKMENDPKFDLEALVRTRGRFTEHERISYRDRLQQNLRNAQSEPNFMHMNARIGARDSDEDSDGFMRRRNPLHASKLSLINESSDRLNRRNRFYDADDKNNTMKSESYSENIRRQWELQRDLDNEIEKKPQRKPVPKPLPPLSKAISSSNQDLSRQKNQIDRFREMMKKTNKNLSTAELNKLTLKAIRNHVVNVKEEEKARRNKSNDNHSDDNEVPQKATSGTRSGHMTRTRKEAGKSSSEVNENTDRRVVASKHHHTRARERSANGVAENVAPSGGGAVRKRCDKSRQRKLVGSSDSIAINSSSLIDDSVKDEDTSLMSKCRNITQKYKTDGAKALCDMVKGKLGDKLMKHMKQGPSKLVHKMHEIGHSMHHEKKSRSHSRHRNKGSPSASPHRSKSRHRDPSAENTRHQKHKYENLDKLSKGAKSDTKSKHHEKNTRSSRPSDRYGSDGLSDEETISTKYRKAESAAPSGNRHRKLSNISEDSASEVTQSRKSSPPHKYHRSASNRPQIPQAPKRNAQKADRKVASPPRPAPPKRPPPPRPTSPPLATNSYERLDDDIRTTARSNHGKNRRDLVVSDSEDTSFLNSNSRMDSSPQMAKRKPKLPPPPKNNKSITFSDHTEPLNGYQTYEMEEFKYGTKSNRHNETMISMLEYQSIQEINQKIKTATYKNKDGGRDGGDLKSMRTLKKAQKVQSISPSPVLSRKPKSKPSYEDASPPPSHTYKRNMLKIKAAHAYRDRD